MRVPNERAGPWVSYWEPDPSSPFGTPSAAQQRPEFFHLDSDAEGQPTRWHDARVGELARANGWTPPVEATSRRS